MKSFSNLCLVIALVFLSFGGASGQAEVNATKHYENASLAFDYPEGWVLTENTSNVQTVTRTQQGSLAQIVVNIQDGLTSCNFQSERKAIADSLTEKLATEIHARPPHSALPVTTQIGGSEVEGSRLQGSINQKPVTGDVYSTRLNQHFVSLVYIVAANDKEANSAWNTIRTTLTTKLPVLGTEIADSAKPITAGVLNGKALALPQPEYTGIAKSAHAVGTVTVQVVIDEAGNVISAHAVAGHPLLQGTSVAAAKQAKFSPVKLCGEPVRVTGVITYTFVPR